MDRSSWTKQSLASLTSRIGDGIHGTPSYIDNGGFPFVNGNNLKQGHIVITNDTKQVSKDEFEKYYIQFDNQTLFMSINGTLGSLAKYNNEKIILGKSAAYIKCTGIDIDFLYFYLQLTEIQNQLWNIATGSTIKNLSLASIRALEIPIPSSIVQKKITDVLSALDAKIELNNRINAELEAMAQTLYDYWFVQFDFPDNNGKPYKTCGGKMNYNPYLKREIPEGWLYGTLLDIATFTNGLACQKFRSKNEQYYRVIKIREMSAGFTENSELVTINIPEKVIVNNGDVLFSWSATLDVKIWAGGKGALNQHIFKITSKKYPKSYYYFQLLNYLQHFKMMAELRKTTMGHITQEHLQQSGIAIPPINLIAQLDEVIKPILEKKVKLEEESQQLTKLRDWLLPMLMNGQVKVL